MNEVDPGRVDHLGLGIFRNLLKKYGNPQIKVAVALFEPEVEECFQEHLGPGTQADKIGRRIVRAIEGQK